MEEKAISLINEAIFSGIISQETYDLIMKLVHKDGIIDEVESSKLSELFQAIKTDKVKLSNQHENKHFRNSKKYTDLYNERISHENRPARVDVSTQNEMNVAPRDTTVSAVMPDVTHNPLQTNIFKKHSERILEVELCDRIWIKTGSMIAYDGVVNFTREGIAEHGLGKLLKRNITGESLSLSKAEGVGKVYLADGARHITILNLGTQPLYIQSQNVLAFEKEISWDVQPLFNIGTALAGGLFHLMFRGKGVVAFSTSFEPLRLEVKPGKTIYTDAKSTVAWSSGVVPNLRADVSLQTLIGRTSGETVQIRFEGQGYVFVEP